MLEIMPKKPKRAKMKRAAPGPKPSVLKIKGKWQGRSKEVSSEEETAAGLAEIISLESCVMTNEPKSRSMPVSDFIAEGLEDAAKSLPPSEKGQAQHLLECASIIRKIGDSRVIKITEQG